jgi:hypothetical protein
VLTHQFSYHGHFRPASTQQDPWWGSVRIPLHSACAPEITHIQTQNSAQKTIPIGVSELFHDKFLWTSGGIFFSEKNKWPIFVQQA